MVGHVELSAAYVLSVGLLFVLVLVLFEHRQRTGRGLGIGLLCGIIGITLGSIGTYAAGRVPGLSFLAGGPAMSAPAQLVESAPATDESDTDEASTLRRSSSNPPATPNPKRELALLVRKLNLLTDDIQLKLTSEQSHALMQSLAGVDEAELLSETEALQRHEQLLSVLNTEQQAKLNAIGLPPLVRRETTRNVLREFRERLGSDAPVTP